MLYSPEEEKSQGRGSAEHGQRFWLLWDRCGFSPSDQSRPQGFDLPPASPRDQKRRGRTKHATLFLVTEEDSETTPTRLRAVPSRCPQAPLAASATWLAAKRLDSGRAEPVRQILRCRSRAEGPGVRGPDLPLLRSARWSGIGQNKLGKIPSFQLLASQNGVRRRESRSCPNISVNRHGQGPARGAWDCHQLLLGPGTGGKAGLKCWEFSRDEKGGFGPFAPMSSPSGPQPEPSR